ncbi:S-layer homology domain-containing protein [Fusibacter paucivorans]|uniref:S-layer homology domain-containing protein n=1 Tax=Fusibacter paucivorans TaxID=76009 RepID=A0ABS5PPS6_9FIRM|nr:S-layer homology domain-containing protein [Fusibacter paucivorans]MBS7526591.1 S-layer homology domain-containing protein [Fusibacter paucivorans]
MKKGLLILMAVICLTAGAAFGQVTWLDGGVVGDVLLDGTNEYQEMCFVTGAPVLLKGTVTIPTVPTNAATYNLSYSYELANLTAGITLERTAVFRVTLDERSTVNQTLYSKELTSYDETITTDSGEYTLGKYTYQEGRLIDNTPAVDYFSGNMVAERTYYLDGDYMTNSGTLSIAVESDPIVGYDHQWGSSETQKVHQMLTHTTDEGTWNGSIDVNMASTKYVNFLYQGTDPQSISFRGSYFKITSEENVLNYAYDLPRQTNGAVDYNSTRRNIGESSVSDDVILESKALITPKMRDIGGHWAEIPIFLMTSLEVFDASNEYFAPDAMISRIDFGKAVVNAIAGVLPTPTRTDVIRRLRPGVDTPYLDVLPDDPDYHYLEYIKEHQIMAGENSYFKPNETVTRAQAVAIMINALGLQYNAPSPPYETVFKDDAYISEWAKDYVYVANEIGLVNGDTEGNFNPNKPLSRAEAAAMISGFISHIKDDITYDYREKIMNN